MSNDLPTPLPNAPKRFRGWTAIASLIVVCGLLVTALYVLRQNPASQAFQSSPADHPAAFRTDPDSIHSVLIAPKSSPPYTLVRTGMGYQVDGAPEYPLKKEELENLLAHVQSIEPADIVGEIAEIDGGLSQFGFDDAVGVTIRMKDGSSVALRFGADAPTEVPSVYLTVEDDPHLYTINASVRNLFDRGLHFLHTVPDISIADTSTIAGISVTSQAGNLVITRDMDNGFDLVAPIYYPVNQQAMTALLDQVANLRLAVFAEDVTADTDIAAYGFADDSTLVTITFSDAPPLTLRIGADIQGLGVYCRFDGAIYMASYMAVGFLTQLTPERIASQKVTEIPYHKVRQLQLHLDQHVYTYDILWYERIAPNNALVYGDDGLVIMDAEVSSKGSVINATPLKQFYERIIALRPTKADMEISSEEAPWLRLLIQTDSKQQTLAFYRTPDGGSALALDGVMLWAFEEAALRTAVNELLGV